MAFSVIWQQNRYSPQSFGKRALIVVAPSRRVFHLAWG
jgi:hypothetical protein